MERGQRTATSGACVNLAVSISSEAPYSNLPPRFGSASRRMALAAGVRDSFP